MDRRKFLKASAAGLGATALLSIPVVSAELTHKKTGTRLETQGWVKEPARKIPVIADADVIHLTILRAYNSFMGIAFK